MKKIPKFFQKARLCVLLENGAFVGADGAEAVRPPGASLVLSRALCRFKLFRAPEGLSQAQLARAARTFSQAHAPFAETGALLLRSPHGVGIWYWDNARVASGGPLTRVVVPETLLRASGDGWRVIACVEGFEAQYWEAGALLASSWRRTRFSDEQWAAFALGVDKPAIEPGDAPPAAIEAPLQVDAPWRRNQIREPLSWREGENILLTAALCMAALAAFFCGHALRYEGAARADERRAAALEARMQADPALLRVRERTSLLSEFNAVAGGGDVLGAVADAFGVLEQFAQQPESWSVDQSEFRATINISAAEAPLREIVTALENTPSLCAVAPTFLDGGLELRAALAETGCPP